MGRAWAIVLALAAADLAALGARVSSEDGGAAEPASRSGKGGEESASAPAAGRKASVTTPPPQPPAARSGKGGRPAAPVADPPAAPEASRSGKGGRTPELEAEEPVVEPMKEAVVAISEIRKRVRELRREVEGPMAPEWEAAASRVVKLPAFQAAKVIRVHLNIRTDHVRLAALQAGKKLVVVIKDMYELLLVDPAKIRKSQYEEAATPSGIKKFGRKLDVTSTTLKVDLFVIASMAVDSRSGCRVGPRGSSEELEYGMLREIGALSKKTPVVTIADSYALVQGITLQEGLLCSKVPADIVCTAKRTFVVKRQGRKLQGLDWEKLGNRKLGALRLLRKLKSMKAEA